MKQRILFIGLVCVLLYGWYQIGILPYVSNGTSRTNDLQAQARTNMFGKGSNVHASALLLPGVW